MNVLGCCQTGLHISYTRTTTPKFKKNALFLEKFKITSAVCTAKCFVNPTIVVVDDVL